MKKTLIAVYGTLRKGFGNYNNHLTNAEYLGTFNTPPIYSLYDLGGFPGLKNNGTTSVVMEVYSVNPQEAYGVDRLEGYSENQTPYFYDKQPIETPWGTAGVYVYVNNLSGVPIVESGDYYEHRKGEKSKEHETKENLTTI